MVTNLSTLRDLLVPKAEPPETTLSLIRAVRDPHRTLETYRFTDSIRGYFETILETVAQGTGQGFWIPAEYGAGKTHFLATLACMLSDTSEQLWERVTDPEIANYRKRLDRTRLFPVLVSLRGESGVPDELAGRQLLEIIESAIEQQLEATGLRDEVSITTADEIYNWFNSQPDDLRAVIEEHVRSATGLPAEEYTAQEGVDALANLIRQYAEAHRIRPVISVSIKERMVNVFRQLKAAGYQGMLFIVDEFAFWQDKHPEGSPEYAHDEDVLETLGWILPRDYDLPIYTVVASQKPPPTKLTGDRFHELRLLGEPEKHEYEMIVCWRVRDLVEERTPEINQYYDYYSKEFRFMQNVSRQFFRDIFPFQPRCFDVMRLITQRELPTVRLGIFAIWETLTAPEVLDRDGLITVSELLHSRQLEKGLHMPSYEQAYEAYLAACRGLDSLGLTGEDLSSAHRLLKTLFLWHVANLDSPSPLSAHDLAEATLTTSQILGKEDEVALLLKQLDDLPQVSYSREKGATFNVTGELEGPAQIFEGVKRTIRDEFVIQKSWESSLRWSITETGSEESGIFHDLSLGQAKPWKVDYHRIEYRGEVILDHTWRPEYGEIRKENLHFRIVLLTHSQEVPEDDLRDRRIAVCIPGDLSSSAKEAICDYEALQEMTKRYQSRVGPEAEAIRNWLLGKRPEVITEVVGKQLSQYRTGTVVTRSKLAIDPREMFATRQNDPRFKKMAGVLLSDAYKALPIKSNLLKKVLKDRDAAKVFTGLLQGDQSSAATSAAENFSVGLVLAKPQNPRRFAPEGCKVMDYLSGKMESEDSEVHLWKVYDELGGEPWGLTSNLISLYLLAFVRRGDPSVEIRLRPDHNITLRSGADLVQNTIKASTIFDLEWKSGLERHLSTATLGRSIGPVWNDVCPFAKVIAPNLRPATDPGQIKLQEQSLLAELERLKEDVARVKENLLLLARRLEEKLSDDDEIILQSLSTIAKSDTYVSFYEGLMEQHYDLESFANDFARHKQLASVSSITAEVIEAKNYLDALSLREKDKELAADKISILGQISLTSLLQNPQLWPGIREQYSQFKKRYRSAYQIHHRDYYKVVASLAKDLEDAQSKVSALQQLNTISELGSPLGQGLKERHAQLFSLLSACSIIKVTDVNVESSPTCSECLLALTKEPPEEEVRAFLDELQEALDEQLRRVSDEAIRSILAQSKQSKVKKFVEIVQAADLASLINVMDAKLVNFIRELLRESNIQTEPSLVLDELAEKFPAVEEEQVPEVASELEDLLENEFKAAKKKHPKKKIRISLK